MTAPDRPEPDRDGTKPDGTMPDGTMPDGTMPDGTEPDRTEPAQPGRRLLQADLVGTAALALVSLVAATAPSDTTTVAMLVVAATLFVGGCGAFAVGFVGVAGRSRHEVVDLAGTFYLTGSAPEPVRRRFLGLWFAQIAVAAASVAAVRPPFGVMAPLWGIGLITVWAARHGTFPPRPASPRH